MIIVNVTGEPFKRYVVDEDEEFLFDDYDPEGAWFCFGAQAWRRNGIDEQYRLLGSECITKVSRR